MSYDEEALIINASVVTEQLLSHMAKDSLMLNGLQNFLWVSFEQIAICSLHFLCFASSIRKAMFKNQNKTKNKNKDIVHKISLCYKCIHQTVLITLKKRKLVDNTHFVLLIAGSGPILGSFAHINNFCPRAKLGA